MLLGLLLSCSLNRKRVINASLKWRVQVVSMHSSLRHSHHLMAGPEPDPLSRQAKRSPCCRPPPGRGVLDVSASAGPHPSFSLVFARQFTISNSRPHSTSTRFLTHTIPYFVVANIRHRSHSHRTAETPTTTNTIFTGPASSSFQPPATVSPGTRSLATFGGLDY